MSTTISLFQKAGIDVNSIHDILNFGIYITNAAKTPKSEYAVSKDSIEESLPALEREIHYLEVLTAQQALLGAQQSEVQCRYDEIAGIITLYHALGGGR